MLYLGLYKLSVANRQLPVVIYSLAISSQLRWLFLGDILNYGPPLSRLDSLTPMCSYKAL